MGFAVGPRENNIMKTINQAVMVLGATGTQGGAVCRHLSARGEVRILAITRNAQSDKAQRLAELPNVSLVECDADIPGALEAVIAAQPPLDGFFSVQVNDFTPAAVAKEITQGKLVVDLCSKYGVGHLVYSSVAELRPSKLSDIGTKIQIEEHLRASAVRFTILRPTFFLENFLPGGFAETSGSAIGYPGFVANNTIPQQYMYIDDLGMIAVEVFADPNRWEGRTLELASGDLTPAELLAVFTKLAGRTMEANEMPSAEFGEDFEPLFVFMRDEGWQSVDIDSLRKDFPQLHTVESALVSAAWHPRRLSVSR